MSVRSYHYLLRNSPEERNSHLLRGRRLKSYNLVILHHVRITYAPTYSNHFQTAVVNKSLSNMQASESARVVTENLSLVLMPLCGYMYVWACSLCRRIVRTRSTNASFVFTNIVPRVIQEPPRMVSKVMITVAQIPVARLLGQINLVRWHLQFWGRSVMELAL